MGIADIKRAINRVCLAIFIFIGVAGFFQVVFEGIFDVLNELYFHNEEVADNLFMGFSYVTAYLISICVYKAVFKKSYRRASFEINMGSHPGAMISASLGLCFMASHLSRFFGGGAGYTQVYHDESIVLMLFTTVLVPAFCEELFFRGLIMTNLLHLGRNFAIIASGVIFGLVHGNHDQILFASIAGIIFGWLYAETGSIWCGIIVHMFNNLIAVAETVLAGTLKYATAIKVCAIIELTVLICGVISLIYLIPRIRRENNNEFKNGGFGFTPPRLLDGGIHYSISEYLRGFFSPAMIAFLVYVVISEVTYVSIYL